MTVEVIEHGLSIYNIKNIDNSKGRDLIDALENILRLYYKKVIMTIYLITENLYYFIQIKMKMDKYIRDIRRYLIREWREVYYKNKPFTIKKINIDWTVFMQYAGGGASWCIGGNPNDYDTVNINELMLTELSKGEVMQNEINGQQEAWDKAKREELYKNLWINN